MKNWLSILWLVICCLVVLPMSFALAIPLFGDCTASRIGVGGTAIFLVVFGLGFFFLLRSTWASRLFALVLTTVFCVLLGLVANFIWSSISGTYDITRIKKTVADIEQIGVAVESYKLEYHVLPKDFSDVAPFVAGDMPVLDAWGNPLRYEVSGDSYTLTSYGACGRPDRSGRYSTSARDFDPRADLVFRDGEFVGQVHSRIGVGLPPVKPTTESERP